MKEKRECIVSIGFRGKGQGDYGDYWIIGIRGIIGLTKDYS